MLDLPTVKYHKTDKDGNIKKPITRNEDFKKAEQMNDKIKAINKFKQLQASGDIQNIKLSEL